MPNWRWPLHSPRRLAATAAAVLAVLAIGVHLVPGGSSAPSRSEVVADAPSTAPSSSPAAGPSPLTSSPVPDPLALVAADGFVRAWAQPSLARDRWWQGVNYFVTPRLSRLLFVTDPGNVPAHRVTGPPEADLTAPEDQVRVRVPTDAGVMVTTLQPAGSGSGHRWLVDRIDTVGSAY